MSQKNRSNLPSSLIDELHEIGNWLQSAVMDIALDAKTMNYYGHEEMIEKLKKRGVEKRYWSEALVDELYNDADTVCDLCGDRIFDALNMAGYKCNDDSFKDTFNEAVHYFAIRVVTHIDELEEKLRY